MDVIRKTLMALAPIVLAAAIIISAARSPDDEPLARPSPSPSARVSPTPVETASVWRNAQGTSALVELRRSEPEAGWVEITDPRGWSFRMPAYWHATGLDNFCRNHFEATFGGNLEHEYRTRNRCPGLAELVGLPRHHVIVAISRSSGAPPPLPYDGPLTMFPLSLDTFERNAAGYGLQIYLKNGISEGRYHVGVLVGSESNEANRKIAEKIVSSILFDKP